MRQPVPHPRRRLLRVGAERFPTGRDLPCQIPRGLSLLSAPSRGMNDPRLKPRILRSVARDLLPDDKRPFPSSSNLSSILSYVKTHGLLTERNFQPSDRKLIDGWRSAVDDWVDRLLSLVSSNMVNCFVFDKTGTLTAGKLVVVGTRLLNNMVLLKFYKYIAAADVNKEHPFAKAIVEYT